MFEDFRWQIKSRARDAWLALRSLTVTVNPTPIIILGNQKSGTSAIAALLAEMTGLTAALDLPRERHAPKTDRLRRGLSMAAFVRHNRMGFSKDIVKEPSLSPFYVELADFFPRARFVMVIRDPRDNIRSILNRHHFPGDGRRLSGDQWQLLSKAWRLIYDGRWLGLEGPGYIDMLAARWNLIADLYLQHAEGMALVRYESFVADKAGTIARLAAQLDLEARHDIGHLVDIPFQPPGDRNVDWQEFFGDNLRRIEGTCGPLMKPLHYEPIAE